MSPAAIALRDVEKVRCVANGRIARTTAVRIVFDEGVKASNWGVDEEVENSQTLADSMGEARENRIIRHLMIPYW